MVQTHLHAQGDWNLSGATVSYAHPVTPRRSSHPPLVLSLATGPAISFSSSAIAVIKTFMIAELRKYIIEKYFLQIKFTSKAAT